VSQAKQLDRRTREAWHGTPHLSYIKNRTGGTFAGKMTESLKALARILGVPEPLEYERKFLVGGFSPRRLPAAARGVDIIQTYLMSPPGTFERVRARGIGGQWHYFHTIKEPRSDGQAAEYERVVDIHEYNTLLRRVDPLREPIEKIRYCFTRGHHYVEVDVFKNRPGLVLAEIELEDAQTPYDAPQFLGTVTEVTGMKAYSNYQIALREISQ
jgi:CYTH domain-containing protein